MVGDCYYEASLMTQLVKNPPANAGDTLAGSILGWENLLEKKMEPCSNILVGKFHG